MNEHEAGQVAASAADVYETFFVPALFADWPPHVLAAAGVQAGDAVLDVACGTGVLSRAAAEQVGENGGVTGVDINDGMLAVARSKAPKVAWQNGAAESLPFEDDSFDRVVSQFGLMFFADQLQALREMKRVVRENGRVAVAVWGSLADTAGYQAVYEMLNEQFGPDIAQSIEMPYSLGDVATLMTLFSTAGFADAQVQTITGTVRFDSIEAWLYTDIRGWTLADMIDDAGYAELQKVAAHKLRPFAQADGSVAFAAPAHIVTF